MTRTLLTCSVALLFSAQHIAAQTNGYIYQGQGMDSLEMHFGTNDPLVSNTTVFYIGRDSTDSLWQIGPTSKTFFANNYTGHAIMTDTVNKYPDSADCSFYVRTNTIFDFNFILSWVHKYQTDSGKAGGIVEFSTDTGKTWRNIIGNCTSYQGFMPGIIPNNTYDTTTKLWTGEPAFTGTSNGWQKSTIQFFTSLPLKTTGPGQNCVYPAPLVRFRFKSDSTTNTTNDGWIIDSIRLEQDKYYGNVAALDKTGTLNIHPNPAYNGIFSLPQLEGEEHYRIEVYNATGQQVVSQPYTHRLDMSAYSKGLYLYRITDGDRLYTGRLVVQ